MTIDIIKAKQPVRLVGTDAYDDKVMVKVDAKQVLRAVTCVTEVSHLWGRHRKHVQRCCEIGLFACEVIGGQYIIITQSVVDVWGTPAKSLGAYRNE